MHTALCSLAACPLACLDALAGHMLSASGQLQPCPDGTFSSAWRQPDQAGSCTACGRGMRSEPGATGGAVLLGLAVGPDGEEAEGLALPIRGNLQACCEWTHMGWKLQHPAAVGAAIGLERCTACQPLTGTMRPVASSKCTPCRNCSELLIRQLLLLLLLYCYAAVGAAAASVDTPVGYGLYDNGAGGFTAQPCSNNSYGKQP